MLLLESKLIHLIYKKTVSVVISISFFEFRSLESAGKERKVVERGKGREVIQDLASHSYTGHHV